ncbi:MAG: type II toxin-antitoxin system Phd/YefM family antitoxin [Planctomycetes bacterium]|nr:type II toxin-antitoxin system Phd/YefM family antitoxin [Planctomycetota bacterium]
MVLSRSVKPISYLKSRTSEAVRFVTTTKKPLLITHHGKVKVVVQDVEEYEALQESLTLLKILALGEESRRKGRAKPLPKAIAAVRVRLERATR